MKVVIKDKEIELKYSFRALMIYENIQGKAFNPTTVSDMIVFMYSVVLASDKSMNIKFDDFMDFVDNNPLLINEFSEWLSGVFNKNQLLSPEQPTQKQVDKAKEDSEKN